MTDADSVDAVARYEWNMSLAAAVAPALHLVEVALRNAIYTAGVQATAGRTLKFGVVPCWLDTRPSLLEPAEERDVVEAIKRLGHNRRRTPGHLVGQLGFGFWVRLCQRPYEHGRPSGPRLWPAALKFFPNRPRPSRNRPDVHRAFAEVRDFRNVVAHPMPIWDRKPVEQHARALELLGWMNPALAAVAGEASTVKAVFDAGPAAFRPHAERIVTL